MKTKLLLLLSSLAVWACSTPSASSYKILVGTYTAKGSDGIYYYTVDDNLENIQLVSKTQGVENPSFLRYQNGVVYAVNENEVGKIQAFGFDENSGAFNFLNEKETEGAHPCYVTTTANQVLVGNYSGGNFAVFPIEKEGKLGDKSQLFANAGTGPVTDRQEKSHVHSVNIAPNGKEAWVADLGTDELLVFESQGNEWVEKKRVKLAPGSGPRHLAFHPKLDLVYVINELNNTINSISTQDYSVKQILKTLPEDFTGKSFTADIHLSPDAKFLYGSNRYSDNLVVYKVSDDGNLSFVEQVDVKGKVPRNFALTPDGKYVFVANQDSDNITVFKRDAETGKLSYTGKEIQVSMPVCVQVIP